MHLLICILGVTVSLLGCANGFVVVLFVWDFLLSLPSSASLYLKTVLCLLDLVPPVFYSLPSVLSVPFNAGS